jgi:hypothetical protein
VSHASPGDDSFFYAAAERRIWRLQLALAPVGAAAAWWLAGAGAAIAFAVGAAVSGLNFLWLTQAVDALVEAATAAGASAAPLATRRKRRLVVWKFVGRYLLIGVAAYVILKHTAWSAAALFAGLFLFVAAVLAEIGWEIFTELKNVRHGA